MYKIIAVDIDGTLVKIGSKELDDVTKETLIKAQEMGIKVVVTTGRPLKGMQKIVDALKIGDYNGYAIGFNGAKIYKMPSGEVVSEEGIDVDILPEIFKFARDNEINCSTYSNEYFYVENPEEKYLKFVGGIEGHTIVKRDFLKDPIDFKIPKILFGGDEAVIKEIEILAKEKFKDKLTIFRSEPFLLELLPPNTDKGMALKKLIEILGYKREDILAFGDGYNDITMLKFAGMGVAMGNASDTVKKCADFVTLTYEENGVAYGVKKFALQEQ